MRTSAELTRRAFAALPAALLLAGCTSRNPLETGTGGDRAVVVGSSDVSESELLMEVYAGALESTGAEVHTRPRIGSRELYVTALRRGELTLVPDYTGNLLSYLESLAGGPAGGDPTAAAGETGAVGVYRALLERLPPELAVLDQSPAQDSDVLTVTRDTAERLGLRSLADLAPHCPAMTLGAPAEWKQRWVSKIDRLYGCRFGEIRSLDAGAITVQALRDDQIQVANLFTTSAQIQRNGFVKLADPKHMYPAQNVVPLVSAGRLTPVQRDALNRVSAALTTEELTEMNWRVETRKDNPVDVARDFLTRSGV